MGVCCKWSVCREEMYMGSTIFFQNVSNTFHSTAGVNKVVKNQNCFTFNIAIHSLDLNSATMQVAVFGNIDELKSQLVRKNARPFQAAKIWTRNHGIFNVHIFLDVVNEQINCR